MHEIRSLLNLTLAANVLAANTIVFWLDYCERWVTLWGWNSNWCRVNWIHVRQIEEFSTFTSRYRINRGIFRDLADLCYLLWSYLLKCLVDAHVLLWLFPWLCLPLDHYYGDGGLGSITQQASYIDHYRHHRWNWNDGKWGWIALFRWNDRLTWLEIWVFVANCDINWAYFDSSFQNLQKWVENYRWSGLT